MASVDLRTDCLAWQPMEPSEVIEDDEGIGYDVAASGRGASVWVLQLRNSFVIADCGSWMMFYTAAGESSISAERFYPEMGFKSLI